MIIKTQDGHVVTPYSSVYEVMYRYLNAEVSVPEPEKRFVIDIPPGTKYWLDKRECERECRRIEFNRKWK